MLVIDTIRLHAVIIISKLVIVLHVFLSITIHVAECLYALLHVQCFRNVIPSFIRQRIKRWIFDSMSNYKIIRHR